MSERQELERHKERQYYGSKVSLCFKVFFPESFLTCIFKDFNKILKNFPKEHQKFV